MFLGFLAKSILIGDYVIDFFKTFLMTVFLSYSSLDWPELSQKYCELQVLRPTYLCTSVNCSVPTSQALHLSRVSTGMGLFYNFINHQRNQTNF